MVDPVTTFLGLMGIGCLIICAWYLISIFIKTSDRNNAIKQYNYLLQKFNAGGAEYWIYEAGLDEVPKNTVACVFFQASAIGFQLDNHKYDKIILLPIKKINWLTILKPFETIDIEGIELTPFATEYRAVISYNSETEECNQYIIFNTGLYEYDTRNNINKITNEVLHCNIMEYLSRYFPDCPKHLIRSNNVYTSETVEL